MKKLLGIVVLGLFIGNSAQAGFFDIFKRTPNWIKSLCAEKAGKSNNDDAAERIYDACVEEQKTWVESLKKKK